MAWVFGVSLFLSASLLFVIQPLMGAVTLPKFGGGPAVWNSCMVFYQAMLLAGYAYAHFAPRHLGPDRQRRLHLVLLFLPLLLLPLGWLIWPFATAPLGLAESWAPPASDFPAPFVVMVLLATIGVPFFVLSTSAPLLQKWYAATGRRGSQDPYFLYAASNLGSLIALLGYPFVIERYLSLPTQGWIWLVGYVVFAALIAGCMMLASGGRQPPVVPVMPEAIQSADTPRGADAPRSPTDDAAPTTWQRFMWVARAFVPSSLMLGVTTHFTTEIAPVPLLWVVPLAVYLVSFIIAFSRLPVAGLRVFNLWMPGAVLLLAYLLLSETKPGMAWAFAAHLGVLFVIATSLHGAIAESRPAPAYLTEFFLWIALGGVLGGSFNAWVAPLVFSGVAEYPIALILAALLLPPLIREEPVDWRAMTDAALLIVVGVMGGILLIQMAGRGPVGAWLAPNALIVAAAIVLYVLLGVPLVLLAKSDHLRWAFDWLMPLAIAVFSLGLRMTTSMTPILIALSALLVTLTAVAVMDCWQGRWRHLLYLCWPTLGLNWLIYELLLHDPNSIDKNLIHLGLPLLLAAATLDRPLRFGLGIAAVFVVNLLFAHIVTDDVLYRERSFFGVCKVIEYEVNGETIHRLVHGSIMHGRQPRDPKLRDMPSSYYHAEGPLGELMTELERRQLQRPIGVIGLGTGTMAAWARPGQEIAFIEIDPTIVRIAQNPKLFTYWTDAEKRGVKARIVLGDGRVKLSQEPDGHFGVIVVDAFSSDAIPAHLLTREAIRTYMKKLAPGGVLAVHISNRYLDLEPVLGNLAHDAGLVAFERFDKEDFGMKEASDWVLLARRAEDLAGVVDLPGWKPLGPNPAHRLWTDDFRNLLDVYRWDS